MNKWNKRFIKILISITIIVSVSLLAMRILGKQNRTAYLTNFNLNIDRTLELNNLEYLKTNFIFIIENKLENKLEDKLIEDKNNYLLTNNNITNYSYRFIIRYYDKVFRNSDIYGVYPDLSNLPEFVKEIKMDGGGSPYGSLISDKIIDYEEKIDNINYILEIKGKIFIILYVLIIVLLFCFALNFHNKYKASTEINNFIEINRYKKIMVFAIFSILAISLISIIILKFNSLIFEPLFYLTFIFIIMSALTLFLYLKFNSFSMKYDIPCVYLLSICVFFIMFYAHELYKFEFGKSFLYGYGDMMQFLTVMAGVIREPIFPIPTDNLGYPFGGYIGTYSMFLLMNFEILKIKILSLFTKDPIDLFNYAYLSIPFITAIISFYVMRNLKLSRFMSIFGSLIFPFMIYYFRRHFEHYNYSAIYFIPLTVLLCVWLFKYDDLLMPNKNFFKIFKTFKIFKIFKNKRNIIAIIFMWLIANNGGGYYQFFSCFLICASALSKFLKVKKLKSLIPYAITLSIILLFFIINLTPYFIYKTNHNISAKVVRGFQASEEFGLKISHLFLNPRLFSDYYERAVLFNENSDAYLGIVGILGFVGLLLYLFFKDNYDRKNALNILSDLNIMSVLYATVGGFSALFSFFISDIIRAPTRMSIYIAYICILAFCIFIDKLKNKNIYFYIAMSFLLIFTLFEQTYRNPKRLELYDRHFYADISLLESDRNLIETIEKIMPKNSAIYQLPTYSLSPLDETIKVNGFLSYKLCVGYVFSKNLKWSFGIDFGRKENEWFDKVSEMDAFNMLNEISYACFDGILIDKDYFADKDYIENLSKNISFLLNQEPLISEKGNLVFFSLIDFKENKKENKLDKNYKPLINNYLSKSVGGG